MKKITLFAIQFFVVLVSYAQINVGDIIITELMNNPTKVSDTNGEYFEVYNTTSSSIDINGFIIGDRNSSHTINQSAVVPPNSFAVLGRNADSNTNGGVIVDYEYTSTITLLNSGSSELSLTYNSILIDNVAYDYSTFDFEDGKSLELAMSKFSHTDNDVASNWKASTSTYGEGDYGTPGSANTFTLGIGITQIEKFKLSPNPITNGTFSISTAKNATKHIALYNFLGEVVLKTKTTNNQLINVANLQSGVYLLKVEEEGKLATRKVIIQ